MKLTALPDHLRIIETSDGSPSMEIFYDQASERMHSSHGAFTESIYIYQFALNYAQKMNLEFEILSVGLGLGYNEIISSAQALKYQKPLKISFFESEPALVESFQQWSENPLGFDEKPLTCIYQQILQRTAAHFQLAIGDLASAIQDFSQSECYKSLGALDSQFHSFEKWSVIYFDPFSSKTSPDFWTENFIDHFLRQTCNDRCVLSTYAATGNLKRALKLHDFGIDLRPGFSGKRHSIFAVRPLSSLSI